MLPNSVTDLTPTDTADSPYYYTFRVQCTSCRETHANWVGVNRHVSPSPVEDTNRQSLPDERLLALSKSHGRVRANRVLIESCVKGMNEQSGSRGEANFVWRCKNCKVSHLLLKGSGVAFSELDPYILYETGDFEVC